MSSTSFQRSSFSFPFVFFWAAGGVFDDGPGAERRQLGVQRADVGGQDARLRAPHPQNADRAQTERCSVRFSFVFFGFFSVWGLLSLSNGVPPSSNGSSTINERV